ncbi:gamma-crystallin M2-like [Denticeps clupeoides]|uniref:Beta/gamma crystallin 'Greek key' domain-containing protein n=1 Tax=Denticeps clupeoides TaxID=299321 RepID=A0AAY4AYW6_9TELE|nr:gamma-crystallin M2-like [Denticeps clupeoides]
MGKIIFYEDRNFGGHQHECIGDCADLHSFFKHCNSVKVESGCFVVYDRSNYLGHQHFLKRGEYPDCHNATAMTDCIRSCRMIPMYRGSYRMRIYDRHNMGGHMMELRDDCSSIMDHFHMSDIQSCSVTEGHWLMYDKPNYKGKMYYLRPGEYKRCSEWGAMSSRIGSIRRITDF